MNLQKCPAEHFYDGDVYSSCPHCNGGAAMETMPETAAITGFDDSVTEKLDVFADFEVAGAAAVADDIAKTVPLGELISDYKDSDVQEDTQENTISYYENAIGSDPVVGWLVCIEGNHFGEDFKLKAGKNFIGRSAGMDVCLSGDSSVSRERHAIVLFEPNAKLFIVQSGDAKELSYLNDQVVLTPKELNAYDIIKVGATKLMFIPFCSDKFSWNQG